MNRAASLSFASKISASQAEPTARVAKSLSDCAGYRALRTEGEVLSDLVIRALWASFPEESSEDGIAAAASPYFRNKHGEAISPRTIKYWLRGETLPSALHLAALVMMQPKIFMTAWIGSTE